MSRETRIHIIIPAHNVSGQITEVLEGIPAFVDAFTIVDDCSSDGTRERVSASTDPRVTIIRHDINQGVGAQ